MAVTTVEQRAAELADGTIREEAINELVELAGGQRGPLEAAAHSFVARLHRRSDDFVATNALRLVNAALGRVGWVGAGSPGLGGTATPTSDGARASAPAEHRGRRWTRLRRRKPRMAWS
jgi:hypothetical protein